MGPSPPPITTGVPTVRPVASAAAIVPEPTSAGKDVGLLVADPHQLAEGVCRVQPVPQGTVARLGTNGCEKRLALLGAAGVRPDERWSYRVAMLVQQDHAHHLTR